MTAATFDDLFNNFRHTVVRLEALPAYSVGGAEAERIEAWRQHRPRPERSVRTSPWLARIAVTTATEQKAWQRVRVVDEPITEYQRYQLDSYVESQAAGEQVAVVARSRAGVTGPDFWLFDAGHDTAKAAIMRYDEDGHWLGFDVVTDPATVAFLDARYRQVADQAEPLNSYLAARYGASA